MTVLAKTTVPPTTLRTHACPPAPQSQNHGPPPPTGLAQGANPARYATVLTYSKPEKQITESIKSYVYP